MLRQFTNILLSALLLGLIGECDKKIIAPGDCDLPLFCVDRRPVKTFQLFNGSWAGEPGVSDPNKWGLNPNWKNKGITWLMKKIRINYEKGYRRFMVSLPAGVAKEEIAKINEFTLSWPSAQWHVLDTAGIFSISGSVRVDLADSLRPWLSTHTAVQILIYLGFVIDRYDDRTFRVCETLDEKDRAHIPDIDNPDDRATVQRNTEGWLNLTPDHSKPQVGFVFDAAGAGKDAEKRKIRVNKFINLAEYFLKQGVFVGGEPIPEEAEPGKPLSRCAPWFAMKRFHDARDPGRSWRTDPAETHLGFGVRTNESDNIIATHSAFKRGFVIFVYGPNCEDCNDCVACKEWNEFDEFVLKLADAGSGYLK